MDAPGTTQKSAVAVVIGAYLLTLALPTFCLSITAAGLGGLLMNISGVMIVNGEVTHIGGQDLASLLNQGGALGSLFGVLGVLLGVAAFTVAVGLFMLRPWAHPGGLIVNGLYLLYAAQNLVTNGFQLFPFMIALACAVAIFFLLTDANLKRALGRPTGPGLSDQQQ